MATQSKIRWMLTAVAWTIEDPEGQELDTEVFTLVDEALRGVLTPYRWLRPIDNFYLVRLAEDDDTSEHEQLETWDGLVESLAEEAVAWEDAAVVKLIVTPPLTDLPFNGYLPQDMWNQINQWTSLSLEPKRKAR